MPPRPTSHPAVRALRVLLLTAAFLAIALGGLSPAAPALAACGGPSVVATEAQLVNAIDDFNGQAGPCDYEIAFGADIVLTDYLPGMINSNAGITLLIDGAGYTLDTGDNNGGLYLYGVPEVTIDNLTIVDSDDDGIFSHSTNLRVSRTTVFGSESDGLEFHSGVLVLIDSSLTANGDSGLHVETSDASIYVINSTITGNRFSGIHLWEATAFITQATITDNDRGLWAGYNSDVTVNNSILADNEWDCGLESATLDVNYSLVENDDPDYLCGVTDGVDGNIVGQSPLLLPLSNYGGSTETRPPFVLSGGVTAASPAVDAGSDALAVDETSATLTTDQRGAGFPRLVAARVDMGAVEGPVQIVCPAFPILVNDETEWRDAVACYNGVTAAGDYTIELRADIALTDSPLPVDNPTAGVSLTIEGNTHAIDGQDIAGVRPLTVAVDTTVTLNSVDITGGNALGSDNEGGGIRNEGDLTINLSRILGNTTDDDGGGIFNEDDATLAVNNSIVGGNHATYPDGDGGGISNDGYATITDSTISGNSVEGDSTVWAGGVWNEGVMTITRSTIATNSLVAEGAGYGAGIANQASLIIRDSIINGNYMTLDGSEALGGGIYSAADWEEVVQQGYGTQLTIINSTISGNQARGTTSVYGGGLYAMDVNYDCCLDDPVPVLLINTTLAGNSLVADADFGGAGAYFRELDADNGLAVTIHNSILADNVTNSAPGDDCALNLDNDVDFTSLHSLYEAEGDGACGLAAANPDGDGNIVGVDPNLGPLGNNGGDTLTHALLAGSEAIDSGDNALAVDENDNPLPADQRGYVPRVVNGTIDMGAYEVGAEAPVTGAVFMSTTTAGTTGDGLAFGPEDIIQWDGSAWSTWFDGSAAGLMPFNAKHNINAFWIPDASAGDVVMSFAQNARVVPGIGPKVDGMDLVWWDGAAFSLYFDGSDVALTQKTNEKIDGLHVLDGSQSPINGGNCLAYLLISTQGTGRVPNYSGGTLKFGGEDVLGFCATSLGENTAGLWHMVLDGSAEGMPRNSTADFSLSDDGQTLYLTTTGTFNVDSAVGGHSMVYAYDMGTQTFSGPLFIAADNGLPAKVNGLQVEGDLGQ